MSESSKQLIIAISREFGSGGHVIAEDLADRFGLDLYDYRILQSTKIGRASCRERV